MTCVISFVGLLSQSFSASLSANKRPYRSDLAESLSFKLSLVMPAVFVLLSLLMVVVVVVVLMVMVVSVVVCFILVCCCLLSLFVFVFVLLCMPMFEIATLRKVIP